MVKRSCFISFLLLSCLQTTQALPAAFSVLNLAPSTRGGSRLEKEIGTDYCQATMVEATKFILKIFQLKSRKEKLTPKHIRLIIDDSKHATWFRGDDIGISTNYIEQFSDDLKREITGLLYQLVVHPWQWKGNGKTPWVVIQGIAGFVRIKAGYVPNYWKKKGEGNQWNESFDVVAWFLDYCNDETPGFVALFNDKLNRVEYRDSFFIDFLGGKTVEESWIEYKAKFNKN